MCDDRLGIPSNKIREFCGRLFSRVAELLITRKKERREKEK